MISRKHHATEILRRLELHPVVAIIGARQVGKTTLARWIGDHWSGQVTYFDLEKPSDIVRLQDPQFALELLEGLVVLGFAGLTVVYPGRETFSLADAIVVKPVEAFTK